MRALLPLLSLCLLPLYALAQSPDPARVQLDEEGLRLESADGDFRLELGALLQADARLFPARNADGALDTLLLRRVRPILGGRVFGLYDFRLVPDFGGGEARIEDAYVDARPSAALRLRAGRFKAPFGLEYLQSDADMPFPERALPTNLVPNRDVGLQLHGELREGLVHYALGVFAGAVDGTSTDEDEDDGKDVMVRHFAHPLRPLGVGALEHLGVGFALSYGSTRGAQGLPVYRTSGRRTFFRYRAVEPPQDVPIVAGGERIRLSPQAYYYVGPLGLLAEYVASTQEVDSQRLAGRRRLTHTAWQATGSFVLYGGSAAHGGVKPRTPFRPSRGEWGALEVALRHAQLHLDDSTFPSYGDASAASAARASAAALNLYLNAVTRVALSVERTTFEGGTAFDVDPRAELLLLGRVQLSF